MNIIRAAHLGFCFGVRDAIGLALDHPGPLTILGDLVHNESVIEDLRTHGIRFAHAAEDLTTNTVMVTAHGASDRSMAGLRAHGYQLVEATCPLVRLAHRAVLKLAKEGFHPVIVGKRDHVEVRGLTGDLEAFDVVLSEEDVTGLAERPRFGVAAQTTQPIDRVRRLVACLQERFPRSEVRFVDTVCQPTKQRQAAAIAISLEADVVVVIGGASSNNTRELAATCARFCSRVHLVHTADDLRAEWFAGAQTVGITAGTSTPDEMIQAVEQKLNAYAGHTAVEPVTESAGQESHESALAVSVV